jgi:hypothetical protein
MATVKVKTLKDGVMNGNRVHSAGDTAEMNDEIAVRFAHEGAVEISTFAGFGLSPAARALRDTLEREHPRAKPAPTPRVVRVVATESAVDQYVGRRVVSMPGESFDVPEEDAVASMLCGRAFLADGATLSPEGRTLIEKNGHDPDALQQRNRLGGDPKPESPPAPPEVRVVGLQLGIAGNRCVTAVGEEFALIEADAVAEMVAGRVALAKGARLSASGQAHCAEAVRAREAAAAVRARSASRC